VFSVIVNGPGGNGPGGGGSWLIAKVNVPPILGETNLTLETTMSVPLFSLYETIPGRPSRIGLRSNGGSTKLSEVNDPKRLLVLEPSGTPASS